MHDTIADLFLGSTCAACGTPGRVLCRPCDDGLPLGAREAWPVPCPAGLAKPVAAAEYDGAVKALVNAHKEERVLALARPLGRLLAAPVRSQIMDEPSSEGPWLLVPVPSRGAVVRRRGHDPLLRVTRVSAELLRSEGHPVAVLPILVAGRRVRDQAGLGAAERATNLAGTMSCPPARADRVRRRWPTARYLVTDDVVTTGATVREAQRALAERALLVTGIATVAATRRRLPLCPACD